MSPEYWISDPTTKIRINILLVTNVEPRIPTQWRHDIFHVCFVIQHSGEVSVRPPQKSRPRPRHNARMEHETRALARTFSALRRDVRGRSSYRRGCHV